MMETQESKLWAAVILRAWLDLFEKKGKLAADEVLSARQFLTSTKPNWLEWRNHVCSMAGFDGSALYEAAIAKLGETNDKRKTETDRGSQVRTF